MSGQTSIPGIRAGSPAERFARDRAMRLIVPTHYERYCAVGLSSHSLPTLEERRAYRTWLRRCSCAWCGELLRPGQIYDHAGHLECGSCSQLPGGDAE